MEPIPSLWSSQLTTSTPRTASCPVLALSCTVPPATLCRDLALTPTLCAAYCVSALEADVPDGGDSPPPPRTAPAQDPTAFPPLGVQHPQSRGCSSLSSHSASPPAVLVHISPLDIAPGPP